MAPLMELSAKQKKGINQTSTSGGPRHWGWASYRSLEWVTVFGLWRILPMWARMKEESLGNLSLCNTHGKMTKGLLLSALSARSTSIFPLYSSPNHKWMIVLLCALAKVISLRVWEEGLRGYTPKYWNHSSLHLSAVLISQGQPHPGFPFSHAQAFKCSQAGM